MPLSSRVLMAWLAALVLLTACGGNTDRPAEPEPLLAAAVAMRDSVDALIAARQVADADALSDAFLGDLGGRTVEQPLVMAVALDAHLAVILRDRDARRADSTLALAERVVALKDSLGAAAIERSRSLKNLADVCYRRGDPALALVHGRAAYDQRAEALGGPDLLSARIAHNLAIYSQRRQDALHWFGVAYAVRDSLLPSDAFAVGRSAAYLGETLADARRFDEAEPLLLRACEIFAGRDPVWEIKARHRLALMLRARGDFPAALAIYDDLLADWDPANPDHNLLLARHTQASIHKDLGDLATARSIYEELLNVEQRDDTRSEFLTRLGEIQLLTGDLDGAIANLDHSRVIRQRIYGGRHLFLATTLHDLGVAHSRAGHLDSAVVYYEEAWQMRRSLADTDPSDVSRSLQSLALLRLRMGEVATARRLATAAAAAVAQRDDAPSREMRGGALHALALAAATAGDVDSAMTVLADVEAIRRDLLRLYHGSYHEHDARRLADGLNGGISLAMSIADHHPELTTAALDLAVRGRNLDLDVVAARQRWARLAVNSGARAAADTLAARRTHLADLVVRGHDPADPSAYPAAIARARSEFESAETTLARLSRDFEAENTVAHAGLDAVAPRVPRRVPLISYVVYVDSGVYLDAPRFQAAVPMARPPRRTLMYGAIVLHGGRAEFVRLGEVKEIEATVGRWRQAVLAAGDHSALSTDGIAAGTRLRQLIWDPLADHATSAPGIWLVPVAALHLVDLASLPGVAHDYLVEETPPMLRVNSERDLLHATPPGGRGALVLGGPDFDSRAAFRLAGGGGAKTAPEADATHRGADLASLHFRPLPHAVAESDAVVTTWQRAVPREPATHLVGAAATEAAFKEHAPGHRHLHLATHGFVLGSDPATRATSARDTSPLSGLLHSRPLLQSGLALAGANHRVLAAADEEDGILTAAEVVTLDLGGVEGVVLSACETGLGEITSGGNLHGLQRAFRLAGVRSLVMSLWPVPDAMTANWMAVYYEKLLARGVSPSRSAHAANLHGLTACREAKRPAPPLAWSGFVVVGGGR